LTLSEGYFDTVPLVKMKDAECALYLAVDALLDDLRQRISSGDKLTEADHGAMIVMIKKVVDSFQEDKPTSEPTK